MIQCYTPMNNNYESVKDAFYMKTQSTAGNKKKWQDQNVDGLPESNL